ncbi:MAG: helix-turn-helix domain-containing protein [Ruegeria sp.]
MSKDIKKKEFGRKLKALNAERGWNQSELARRAGIPRDSVSTYVRGVSLPNSKSLQKLADALGTTPADLIPNMVQDATEEESTSLNMRVSTGAPNTAWLQVNRLVSLTTAVKVIEMIEADKLGEWRPSRS